MFTESISSAALEKSMAASWKKAQLINHNIANEDTPGYKAKRLEFESLLKAQIQRRDRITASAKGDRISGIKNISPFVYDDRSTSVRIDENNVNLDSEQVELARTQLHYQAMRDRINSGYALLRYAISGGR